MLVWIAPPPAAPSSRASVPPAYPGSPVVSRSATTRNPTQWLDVLYVTNRDTRPRTVDVAVSRAEEVVLWETHSIEERADGVVDGAEMKIPEFAEKSSDWTITARLQDGDATAYVDVGSISQQVTAVTLELRITPDAEFRTLVDYSDA